MKKLALAVGVVALISTGAMARSSQGHVAGQPGVNGNLSTTLHDRGMTHPARRNGTTGIGKGATTAHVPTYRIHGSFGGKVGSGMGANSTRCACCNSWNCSRSTVVSPESLRLPDLD